MLDNLIGAPPLKPNQHFTPDDGWLVYRSNIEDRSAIYAVAVSQTN